MTLNDIKIAALQLMFTNYSDDIRTADVDDMTNEEYLQYVVNMDAVINRCLGRFETAGVLAPGSVTFYHEDGTVGEYYAKYNLATLASGFASVLRVIHEDGTLYEPAIGYTMQGDTLVLPKLKDSATYTVLYNKRLTRVSIGAVSSTVVDAPNHLAELIPYFIKAELYEEDEPELASQARNIFEASLSTFIRDENGGDTGVQNLYGGLQ